MKQNRGAGLRYRTMPEGLDAQEEALSLLLSDSSELAKKQRRSITESLEEVFIDIVNRVSPRLILEIGAHRGDFAKKCKQLNPLSRVVAFEAHPAVHKRNAEALKKSGVEYVNACVGSYAGVQAFKVPLKDGRERATMGSMLQDRSAESSVTYEVPAVKLDSFLMSEAVVDNAIWIDVEGAISSVLAGAELTMSKCIALYVEVETKERWSGQMLAPELIGRLKKSGMLPFLRDIQRDGWQYNLLFLRENALSGDICREIRDKYFAMAQDRIQEID